MRFCERRYLACMSEALVVAQYLGLGDQRLGQFAGLISIPNILHGRKDFAGLMSKCKHASKFIPEILS
jgi:hypothetical protein